MKSDGHSRAISIGWKCYRNTCYRERRRLPTVLYTLRLCNRHALYCFFCCISATYSQSQQLPWNWASYQSWAGELLTVDGALVTVGFFTCDQILLSQNSLFVLCLLSSSCSSKTCRVCFHWYRLVKMYKKPLPVPQSLWIRHLQMAIMYRFAGTLHLCDSVTLKILSSNSSCVYALCS